MTGRLGKGRQTQGLVGALCLMAMVLGAQTGWAQSSDLQSLANKIDRLQRELGDMQRVVYQGAEPPKSGVSAGGSDLNQAQSARFALRLSQFESALQALTGQVEDLGFAVNRMNGRLDTLSEETRARLDQLERQALAGGSVGLGEIAASQQAPQNLASQPGTIGTISQSDLQAYQQQQGLTAQSAEPVEAASLGGGGSYQLPPGSAEEQYEHAFSLLRQANYEDARYALEAFVQQHPDDTLTGNARYWLGETHYVQGDYNAAAVTFAEAYQAHPDGAKAPASLLKLGMSLAALGAKEDACGTYDELLRRFPGAQANVMQKAKIEHRGLGCP